MTGGSAPPLVAVMLLRRRAARMCPGDLAQTLNASYSGLSEHDLELGTDQPALGGERQTDCTIYWFVYK
jgi:hypothetical protein